MKGGAYGGDVALQQLHAITDEKYAECLRIGHIDSGKQIRRDRRGYSVTFTICSRCEVPYTTKKKLPEWGRTRYPNA